MQKTYLGMDLGGTKLLIRRAERKRGDPPRAGTHRLQHPAGDRGGAFAKHEDYRRQAGFVRKAGGCRRGAGRHLRPQERRLVLAESPAGDNIPLAAMLEERLGVPAAIDNDVRSAATAELLLGWGAKAGTSST